MELKKLKPLVHTFTTGELIARLQATDPDGTSLVTMAGCLRVMRVKRRGPNSVDIEAAEATSRDPYTGEVTVQVLDYARHCALPAAPW